MFRENHIRDVVEVVDLDPVPLGVSVGSKLDVVDSLSHVESVVFATRLSSSRNSKLVSVSVLLNLPLLSARAVVFNPPVRLVVFTSVRD